MGPPDQAKVHAEPDTRPSTGTGSGVLGPSSRIEGAHDDHPQTDPTEGRENLDNGMEPAISGPELLGSGNRIL